MALSALSRLRMQNALADIPSATEIIGVMDGVSTQAVFSTGTDATHLGFFTVTAAVRASALVQTDSTSTRTHAAKTGAALVLTATNIAAATASQTLTDAVATNAGTVATSLNQAQKDLATVINAIIVDVRNIASVLNAVIDDLQLYGLEA